jgi:hypothetical protein
MVAAQQTPAPMPDVIATYAVTLHQRLSPSCELIQPATLIQYKQYEAVALQGRTLRWNVNGTEVIPIE